MGWEAFLGALLPGLVILIAAAATWLKADAAAKSAEKAAQASKTNSDKIDNNTELTKAGAESATANAVIAATVAQEAKTVAGEMKAIVVQKLNGGIDAALEASIGPVRTVVSECTSRIDKLEEYNRTSSHRLFDAINAVHLKLMEMSALQEVTRRSMGVGESLVGVVPDSKPKPVEK